MAESPPSLAPAIRVWLAHSDVAFRAAFCAYLEHTPGVESVRAFHSVAHILRQKVAATPDVIVLDALLVRTGGFSTCPSVTKAFPLATCLVLATGNDVLHNWNSASVRSIPSHLSLDVLVRVIMRTQLRSEQVPVVAGYGLTPRECEVLRALAEGISQKQIAARLNIGAATVNSHVQRLFEKMRVNTATGAVAKAVREHLV